MNSDTEIVVIERREEEQAIEALILAKQNYTVEQLVRMPEDQTDEILHQFYLQARDARLIRLINLWVRALAGSAPANGIFEWRSVAITGDVPTVVVYDSRTGTTRATVGDSVVLNNEIAGREFLQPGNWLRKLRAAYIEKMAGIEHAQEIDRSRRHEQKITDFLTDV